MKISWSKFIFPYNFLLIKKMFLIQFFKIFNQKGKIWENFLQSCSGNFFPSKIQFNLCKNDSHFQNMKRKKICKFVQINFMHIHIRILLQKRREWDFLCYSRANFRSKELSSLWGNLEESNFSWILNNFSQGSQFAFFILFFC